MEDVRTGLAYHSISGPKTKPRRFASIYIPQTPNDPNGPRTIVVNGFTTQVDQSPEAEGQLIDWVENLSQFTFVHRIYVAIDINQDGNLTWVETNMSATNRPSGTIGQPTGVEEIGNAP